jgi:TPR repeat protein
MKAFICLTLALMVGSPAFAQAYSARRLTQRIAPQAPPRSAAPAPQPQAAAAPQYYAPQYSGVAPQAAPRAPLSPAEAAKAEAQKQKNDEKQFEYFKKRAEEGSDHAQYEVGVRYLAGRGVPADEKLGKEWLAKAAKNGNTPAARKLAELGVEPEKADAPGAKNLQASAKVADAKAADNKIPESTPKPPDTK